MPAGEGQPFPAQQRHATRRKRRIGVYAGVTALAAAMPLALSTAASAATTTARPSDTGPCPDTGSVIWELGGPEGGYWVWAGVAVTPIVLSATETFNVAQQEVGINLGPTPTTVQFTSSVAQAYAAAVSTSASFSLPLSALIGTFQAQVSTTITQTTTTTVGVSTTATVPPGDQVIGQYGDEEYDIVFDETTYNALTPANVPYPPSPTNGGICSTPIETQYNAVMPTASQGWQVLPPTPAP